MTAPVQTFLNLPQTKITTRLNAFAAKGAPSMIKMPAFCQRKVLYERLLQILILSAHECLSILSMLMQ